MKTRFEFHGGCRDGSVIHGDDDITLGIDRNPAHAYLVLTNSGQIGTRFRETLPTEMHRAQLEDFAESVREALRVGQVPSRKYPPDYHLYEVTNRKVRPDGMTVRLEYIGEEATASLPEAERNSLQNRSNDVLASHISPGKKRAVWRRVMGLESLDGFRQMLVGSARHSLLPNPGKSRSPAFMEKAKRYVKMIDVMTEAERRHPSTLIDQIARERIAREADAAPEEIERLVQVFESLRDPWTLRESGTPVSEAKKPGVQDLSSLPPRACAALTIRCAIRVGPVIASMDKATRILSEQAVDIVNRYATGQEIDWQSLEETEQSLRIAGLIRQLEGTSLIDRKAVAVVHLAVATVSATRSPALNLTILQNFSFVAGWAAASIAAAVDTGQLDLDEAWRDVNLLRTAMEQREIKDDTPIFQSFFSNQI